MAPSWEHEALTNFLTEINIKHLHQMPTPNSMKLHPINQNPLIEARPRHERARETMKGRISS
jgi:hypothetical protein